jgi:energy-coupling factor transporter ATP-binding protein EcfA2
VTVSKIDLRHYVLAVTDSEKPGAVRGTAFLVSLKDLGYAVTCYHVMGDLTEVKLLFEPTKVLVQAEILPNYSDETLDVAILKIIEPLPRELQKLQLRSGEFLGRKFKSFGFPQPFNGLRASGIIEGLVPSSQASHRAIGGEELLQLRTKDVAKGMSGAPIVLDDSETVVGMVVAGNSTQWNIHSDLAFAQSIDVVLKLCGNLTLRSPIPDRKRWLQHLRFKVDPFLYTDGGSDPHLLDYFYKVPYFFDIVGDISRPETIFVFGADGSGKSSLRNVVGQMCREEGALPVCQENFGALLDKVFGEQIVNTEEHVNQILKIAISTLAEEVQNGKAIVGSNAENRKSQRNFLWSYVSEYETDHVRKQVLKNCLEPNENLIEPLPKDYRELLGSFCRNVNLLFGYSCIYFLVDPIDDIAPDADIAWQVLEPLLSAHLLRGISRDGAAFKFFLNHKFLDPVLNIHWINQRRSTMIYRPFDWSLETLHSLLRERLMQCSEKSPPHVSLGELSSDMDDLDNIVIQRSRCKPRELIGICNRIFSVHCQSPIDQDHILITRDEVAEALRQTDVEAPEPLAIRVLSGHEELDEFTVGGLILEGENTWAEFKSSMRWNVYARKRDTEIDKSIAKTLCGFMNTEGGILLIGVSNEGEVLGLDHDFATLAKDKQNEDGLESAFSDIVKNYLGIVAYGQYLDVNFLNFNNRRVCAIQVAKSSRPMFCTSNRKNEFYCRVRNSTRQLDAKETLEYAKSRFKEYFK